MKFYKRRWQYVRVGTVEIRFTWLPILRAYIVSAPGWERVVTEQLLDELRGRPDWLNQVLCRGASPAMAVA